MKRISFAGMLAGALSLALCLVCTGCGENYIQIGENADGVNHILIENGVGEDITAFSVRRSGDETYPSSMLSDDLSIPVGEIAQLNYDAADGALYDLALTTTSGKLVEVASVPLFGLEKFKVCYEDGVGFYTFVNSDGIEVSSKQDALAAKEAADKLAADTAAADAAAKLALALPTGDALTIDSEASIVAAREAYESLTDDQKELFSPEALAALQDAESGLKAAKEAEAARIAAEEEAARKAEEEAAAAAAYDDYSYESDYSYDYSYDYSAPSQSGDDCTSDNIELRN